ncbi:MAG: hypothetical protein CVV02_11810 [Firmicutes bacterium HGW-Firmicutes-7]|nr:MAG: hypothetical protein CVV02_11810 [Firmicutes bacterium HGW-Firmicutes-7]
MSKQTERFVKGAIILSLAGIIAKFVSVFYRIPLVYLVGDEGIGYFQLVLPFFSIMISAGLIGIPNALSKLIAEDVALGNIQGARKTFKSTLVISIVFGLIISIVMIISTNRVIQITGWPEGTKYVIWGFAISPVFVSIAGAIKGYFQGFQIMHPTAISQIIENFAKVLVGISLAFILLNNGALLSKAVGGAAIGTSVGFIMSALFMVYMFKSKHRKYESFVQEKTSEISDRSYAIQLKRIFILAIPVSIAAAIFSIMSAIDNLTLFRQLAKIGFDNIYATEVTGQMGKAYSIINFPLTISLALSTSIIPAISQSIATNNVEELNSKIQQGIKLAIMLALPAAVGLFVLAEPILTLLYPTSPDGFIYLKVYSICLVFMIVGQTLIGILQGISKQNTPLIALGVAIIVKIILNNLLIATSLKGVGAAIASTVYYLVILLICYFVLKKNTSFKLDKLSVFVKPLIATAVMLVTVFFAYSGIERLLISVSGKASGLNNAVATLLTVVIGIILYFTVLLFTKTFTREELSILPKHKKIIDFLDRKKLL